VLLAANRSVVTVGIVFDVSAVPTVPFTAATESFSLYAISILYCVFAENVVAGDEVDITDDPASVIDVISPLVELALCAIKFVLLPSSIVRILCPETLLNPTKEKSVNAVPSLALYHDEKFVPVIVATSALRVRAVVVVGM